MNLQSKLPAFRNERTDIVADHGTSDIIKEVCKSHYIYASDYDKIAKEFDRYQLKAIAGTLFDWCKNNLRYREESENLQTTRSPAAIIATGNSWGVDCKHYAGFIAGVLDAIKRRGRNFDWCYRFVSYSPFDSTPGHVFVVLFVNGKEIFIDPVLGELDQRSPMYYYKQDKYCSMLQRVSGIGVSRGTLTNGSGLTLQPTTPIVARPTTAPVINLTPVVPVQIEEEKKSSNTGLYLLIAIAAGYYFYKRSKRKK